MTTDPTIRIVRTRHNPRATGGTNRKPWDYSVYPDLTKNQVTAFQTIGETLYMVQMAEHAIMLAFRFILNDDTNLTLEEIDARGGTDKKRTLGQLLHEIRKSSDLREQFNQMLTGFLDKRNNFIHRMWSSNQYGLKDDKQIAQVSVFLRDLQDDAWNVQNVFLACLMHWTKRHGVFEALPESIRTDKHLSQLDGKGLERLVTPKK